MFGAIAGLGEVGVGVFQDRVLIAMTELAGEASVFVVIPLFAFGCAFGSVGIIIGDLRKNSS